MVTLQILVLPFLVRVRVSQQANEDGETQCFAALFVLLAESLCL